MSEKRKDFKGRILNIGESQRRDGRYEYKYVDLRGKRRSLYSWRLTDADKMPYGKKYTESLRSQIKTLQREMAQNIDRNVNMRFEELFSLFMSTKRGLRQRTVEQYEAIYRNHLKDRFGSKKIIDIKYSMVYAFYLELMQEKGYAWETVSHINSVLNGCFTLAVKDDLLVKNPCYKITQGMKRLDTKSADKEKNPLSEEEQKLFLDFVRNTGYKRYHPFFVFLFGTGCRIGEAIGVRWEDCDFENDTISIDHQMTYYSIKGESKNRISPPKTEKGNRTIPMLPSVKKALLEQRKWQMKYGYRSKEVVDGYKDFVFVTTAGTVFNAKNVASLINRIVNTYNARELKRGTDVVLLPKMSPHLFRHTFCTRLCENGIDIKAIQYVMGHESIKTTMDIYVKVTSKLKEDAFAEITSKVNVCGL